MALAGDLLPLRRHRHFRRRWSRKRHVSTPTWLRKDDIARNSQRARRCRSPTQRSIAALALNTIYFWDDPAADLAGDPARVAQRWRAGLSARSICRQRRPIPYSGTASNCTSKTRSGNYSSLPDLGQQHQRLSRSQTFAGRQDHREQLLHRQRVRLTTSPDHPALSELTPSRRDASRTGQDRLAARSGCNFYQRISQRLLGYARWLPQSSLAPCSAMQQPLPGAWAFPASASEHLPQQRRIQRTIRVRNTRRRQSAKLAATRKPAALPFDAGRRRLRFSLISRDRSSDRPRLRG